jgi:hypothetical protein
MDTENVYDLKSIKLPHFSGGIKKSPAIVNTLLDLMSGHGLVVNVYGRFTKP